MSSALKPVLPPAGGQSSPGNPSAAAGKPLTGAQGMAQHGGAPTPYATGPLGHVPQSMAGLPHSNSSLGISTTNSTNIATNMSINAVPSLSQLSQIGTGHPGMNQGTPLNVQGAHGSTAAKGAPMASAAAHGRPAAPSYHSPAGAAPPAREEEGTALPPSQNSAQLMAMHRAQQQQQQQQQNQVQHHDQQSVADRFKPQQQQQQQVAQTQPTVQTQPAVQTQSTAQTQHTQSQSNGTMSGAVEACPKTTVPAPSAATDAKPEVPPAAPPLQNHVPSSQANESNSNSAKPTTDISSSPATTDGVDLPKLNTATPPAAESAPEAPQHTATTPTKVAAVPKEAPKIPSTLKLATTPRTTSRKRDTAKVVKSTESKASANSPVKTPDGRSSGAQNNRPPDKNSKGARTPSEERKSKRTRIRTQPYQSPLPELALITKLSSGSGTPSRAQDEKLIVFYKNEFLAVRNAEGGFYVCQAVQNVYKSSPRIRIRWLSQDKQDKIYIPDFYDFTDFDCILTNINMERVEKGKYNLPKDELERTENILKRALAVESGASAPSLTEEHPDGLDLSLFRDESQLKKKRKSVKRKSTEPLSLDSGNTNNKRPKRTPDKAKSRKASRTPASRSPAKKISKSVSSDKKIVSSGTASSTGSGDKKENGARTARRSDGGRAERAKRRGEAATPVVPKTSPVVDQKKARVLARVALKTAIPATAVQNKKKASRNTPLSKSSGVAQSGAASRSNSSNAKTSTRSQAVGGAAALGVSASALTTASGSVSTSRRGKKTKK